MQDSSHPRDSASPELLNPWIPETDAERDAIREQLAKILESPLFANSKRCSRMLQYTVECALTGPAEHVRERTLGIEVFERAPDYDTSRDPVVRTTAGDIRKRIAQYYQQAGHDGEIRIGLPPGSYVPEFRMPPRCDPAPILEASPVPVTHSRPQRARKPGVAGGMFAMGIAVAGVLIAALWFKPSVSPTSLERFWAPAFTSPGPVLLVIGGPNAVAGATSVAPEPARPKSILDLQREESMPFADATTLSRIAGLMMAKGKPLHIRKHQVLRSDDLREGPVVLIGAFNNDWTLRFVDQMRFSVERDAVTKDGWIADRQSPGGRKWLVRETAPYASVTEDYALISRVLDPRTGRLVVTAAGITKYGTAAAGEFLSDPVYMDRAMRSAPSGWERKNIQILLATELVGESSGPPRVVATHFR